MLSIGHVSPGQEHYYAELASGSYYTESGEPEGTWWGTSAQRLGLSGVVNADDLSSLIQGYAPGGSEPLVRNAGSANRRAGFDLTFSAPKSVSVLWSQADRWIQTEIQRAHKLSVTRALSYIEQKAAFTRRGSGGVELERATMAAALFEHSSARAVGEDLPDPQLHTHCVVANVCFGDDNRSGTLDGSHLYSHKMTAGVLYRAELFAQLRERLSLSAVRRGKWCEIEAVPKELCELFSKRSAAIKSYLEERGQHGAKSGDQAALATRSGKQEVSRQHLFEAWRRVGEEFGFTVIPALFSGNVETEECSLDLVRRVVPLAVSELTEQVGHFGEKDVLRLVAGEVESTGVGIATIRSAVSQALENRNQIVRLGTVRGEERFATREWMALERRLVADARVLVSARRPVRDSVLRDVLSRWESGPVQLSAEQREAVVHVATRGALGLVQGMAGTGKTTMLRAAREVWEASGFRVIGAALAAVAAERLQVGSGIPSRTIHGTMKLLRERRMWFDSNTVLVVDEAGMVGTRQMAGLVDAVSRAGAKLVLVGDTNQLPAIDAGSPFRALLDEHGGAWMSDIRRQQSLWMRGVIADLSRGSVAPALEGFSKRGLLFVGSSQQEACSRLVSDWKRAVSLSSLSETRILTATRVEALRLNLAVQRERIRGQEIGGSAVSVGEVSFHVGDRVLFRANSSLVRNGNTGVVTFASEESRMMKVKIDGGQRVTINLDEYQDVQLGYAATTHSAQGSSVKHCLVLCSDIMQGRELIYVQASRAAVETRLYTDEATAGDNLAELTRKMERSSQNNMAHDVMVESSGISQEPFLEAA